MRDENIASPENVPNDRGLDDILPVFVDGLQNVRRLGFDLGFDRQVQVDTDLFGLEIYDQFGDMVAGMGGGNLLGFKSY